MTVVVGYNDTGQLITVADEDACLVCGMPRSSVVNCAV